MKFYIIDDDPDMVSLMTLLLKAKNHEVYSNCAAAYSLNEIAKIKPDCILTDLMMAEMNGLELCKSLRESPATKSTVIIMVSVQSDDYWKNTAQKSGVNGYVTKPLNKENFVEQVEKIIKETSCS